MNVGIDLNGLSDVSVYTADGKVLRGGKVPSVVVLPAQVPGRSITVIAGEEARRAVEGRGWSWPDSAQISADELSLRIPVARILEAMQTQTSVATPDKVLEAPDLLGAVLEALSGPAAHDPEIQTVIVIPDDGSFSDEVQHRLLDSAARGGLQTTLLWRPVAAVLGLESRLNRFVDQLDGKTIGVLSLLNAGVHVSCLEIEVERPKMGSPYIVPVRREPGIVVRYRKSVLELAREIADEMLVNDPHKGWQILWGDGLVLRWLLRLQTQPAVIQRDGIWQIIDGERPATMSTVELSDDAINELRTHIRKAHYLIYEGPALEAPIHGERLVYYLRELVADGRPSLTFQTQSSHLAARGCVVYLDRRLAKRRTYSDYLPQIRLAVRRGDEPTFVELVPPGHRVEGGEVYEHTQELDLSIPAGASDLKFYVLREGAVAPRFAEIRLPVRPREDVPVSMTLRQRPAQGRARLTLEAAREGTGLGAIEVNWDHMQIKQGLSEYEILEELRSTGVEVPPVIPQPCHALLWTLPGLRRRISLAEAVEELAEAMIDDPDSVGALREPIRDIGSLLTRFQAPYKLTRRAHPERNRQRAVSSDGAIPAPDEELSQDTLDTFDSVLNKISTWLAKPALSEQIRRAIVRTGAWAFLRCPDPIRKHLLEATETGNVIYGVVDYRAMGRCFSTNKECAAFFSVLESSIGVRGKILQYQLEGLFYLLSIREHAAGQLTFAQATLFVEHILARVEEQIQEEKYSRLTRTALRALAAILRYRLINPAFATPGDGALGDRIARVLGQIIKVCTHPKTAPVADLAEEVLKWTEDRGIDPTILHWEDGDDDGEEEEEEEGADGIDGGADGEDGDANE